MERLENYPYLSPNTKYDKVYVFFYRSPRDRHNGQITRLRSLTVYKL